MELILDSAVIAEVEEIAAWGVLDGVTTNPTLIRRSGGDFKETVQRIAELCTGPISAEVTALDTEGMVAEGRDLKESLPDNVIIKVPCTAEGLAATSILAGEGIDVNMTLVFSLSQALLAAKAGAAYLSPFIGRLDDRGEDGMQLITEIMQVWTHNQDLTCKVLAASIRSVEHVEASARLGVHAATIPYKVFKQLIEHELTDSGIESFLADWDAVKAEGRN
jgi:transaldolase